MKVFQISLMFYASALLVSALYVGYMPFIILSALTYVLIARAFYKAYFS